MISRQRKRRFPEKELLNRIRHYEALLRENSVKFEPLHGGPQQKTADQEQLSGPGGPQGDWSSSQSTAAKAERNEGAYEPRYAMVLESLFPPIFCVATR